jgi:pectate lyase
VTSLLAGTSPGTLGECIAASGPRICTFAVAGEIIATTGYAITNPYITIRGDTAPGKGISITKNGVSNGVVLSVNTHDVVIRGLRFRGGNTTGPTSNATAVAFLPSTTAGNGLNNIVFDHNSVNWGQGENFSLYSRKAPTANQARDITLSYNMLAEGLVQPEGYSKTALIAGDTMGTPGTHAPSFADVMTDIDMHHNFWGNSSRRNPELRLGSARFVNNVIYNWGGPVTIFGAMDFDFVGNVGKPGPNTAQYGTAATLLNSLGYWINDAGHDAVHGDQTVHVAGNKLSGKAEQGWGTSLIRNAQVTAQQICNGTTVVTYCKMPNWPVRREGRMSPPTSGTQITATSADVAEGAVLGAGGAGHSRRLDCGGAWVTTAVRDSLEERLLAHYRTPPAAFAYAGCSGNACWPVTAAAASGTTTNNGFPVIPRVTATCSPTSRDNTSCACADSDVDGMPDYWERAFCGSATGCLPFQTNGVGKRWTNLEAFQSGLVVAP